MSWILKHIKIVHRQWYHVLFVIKKLLEEFLHQIQYYHKDYTSFVIFFFSDISCKIPFKLWFAIEDFFNFLSPFKDTKILIFTSTFIPSLVILVFYLISAHAIVATDCFQLRHTMGFTTIAQWN